jgi:hypothetical protein
MGIKRLFSRFIGLWGGLIDGGVGESVGQVELGLLGRLDEFKIRIVVSIH